MVQMLEQAPIFSGLAEDELQAIEQRMVPRHYPKGHRIIEQGEAANSMFLLARGRVQVFVVGEDGRRIVLGERAPGAVFGELALLAGGLRSATVEALDDSEVRLLTRRSFEAVVARHPKVAIGLLRDLAARLCALTEQTGDLALLDAYGRISKLIVGQARRQGDRLVTKRMTQQDIADQVGTSREMVGKVLRELVLGGYISIEGKRIAVEKPLPKRW